MDSGVGLCTTCLGNTTVMTIYTLNYSRCVGECSELGDQYYFIPSAENESVGVCDIKCPADDGNYGVTRMFMNTTSKRCELKCDSNVFISADKVYSVANGSLLENYTGYYVCEVECTDAYPIP